MADEKPDSHAISDESIELLNDVKKGKPRKFVMICNAGSIVSLVLFKKGRFSSHITEARRAGAGQCFFGVVDGKGQDIRFALARADDFTKAPVRNTVLKEFLDESADLKCKPYFEIVDTSPLVLEGDDPLIARFLKLRDAALLACETHPDQAARINALCLQIGGHFDADETELAVAQLEALEKLLGQLASGVAGDKSPDDDDLEEDVAEVLKKLRPLLQTAMELHPTKKDQLLGIVAVIRDHLTNGQATEARTQVLKLGKLLKALVAASSGPGKVAGDVRPPNGAASGQPEGVQSSGEPPPAVFTIWRDAREEVMERLSRLQDALRKNDDRRLHAVADKGLNGITNRLQVGLHVALMEYDRTTGDNRTRLGAAASKAAEDFEKFLASDALVSLIDHNPFKVPVGLQTDLVDALRRVRGMLATDDKTK